MNENNPLLPTSEFILWCRNQGATRVQVDGVVVEFPPAPVKPQGRWLGPDGPPDAPFEPRDDDETQSDAEKAKAARERMMFASSI